MLRCTFLIIFSLTAKIKAEEPGVYFKIEENSFLSDENTIWDGKADSLMSCSQICARQRACKSANFMAKQGTCSLLSAGQTEQAEKLLKWEGSFYLEKVCYQCICRVPRLLLFNMQTIMFDVLLLSRRKLINAGYSTNLH